MRVTLIYAIFLLLCVGCGEQDDGAESPPVSWESLDETDQAMLNHVSQVYRTVAEQPDNIFTPSFRPDMMPTLMVRMALDGTVQHLFSFNIADAQSQKGAQAIEVKAQTGLDGVLRLPATAVFAPADPYHPLFTFDGKQVFLMKYSPLRSQQRLDLSSNVTDRASWPVYVLHETFHRHQLTSWVLPEEEAPQNLEGYPLDSESIALAMLEHHALAAALEAVEQSAARVALERFVATREERRKKSRLVTTLDEESERIEGSARYLEHAYQKANGANINPTKSQLLRSLNELVHPRWGNPASAAAIFGVRRFYETGSAILILLDELGIHWKEQLEKRTPADLLRSAIVAENGETRLAEAKKSYDYTMLVNKAKSFDFSDRSDMYE